VPPSLVEVSMHETKLDNCEMLHKNLLIAWSVFAPSITIQLAGVVAEDEYMAFGVSKQGSSKMIPSDVAVAYIDGYLGHIDDYKLTARVPCSGVVQGRLGVCKDELVGGTDDNQIQSHKRENGVNVLTFRKTLGTLGDPGDFEISTTAPTSAVWALGRLAQNGRRKEPSFHHTYPKNHVQIDFGRKESQNNCYPFTKGGRRQPKATTWGPIRLFDPTLRIFDARLGPSGGARGYSGTTGLPSSGLAWYINGYMTPELYLRRGLSYTFRVEGGNDPYDAEHYHPFVITTDHVGGFYRLSNDQRKDVRVLSGVSFTRRGVPQALASGRLCLWKHQDHADRRLDDTFITFERFRNSLKLECSKEGEAAVLEVTPNVTWPDVVYYQSFTTPYMGWKINVVDNFKGPERHLNGSSAPRRLTSSCALVVATAIVGLIGAATRTALPQQL
jgi:hypothetical protein